MDDDLGDLDDPTDVDGPPVAPDITREYDWLAVFNKGVTAGRQDVIQALRSVLGASPLAEDVELRVLARLADPKEAR